MRDATRQKTKEPAMGERKSLKNSGENSQMSGNLTVVKAKSLAEAGKTGIVAQGIFERVEVTKEGKYKGSQSFFVRDETTDTLYIINGTKVLNDQMNQLQAADKTPVEIAFNGSKLAKSGTAFYDWEVFVRG
jgi:hypothetical protein